MERLDRQRRDLEARLQSVIDSVEYLRQRDAQLSLDAPPQQALMIMEADNDSTNDAHETPPSSLRELGPSPADPIAAHDLVGEQNRTTE